MFRSTIMDRFRFSFYKNLNVCTPVYREYIRPPNIMTTHTSTMRQCLVRGMSGRSVHSHRIFQQVYNIVYLGHIVRNIVAHSKARVQLLQRMIRVVSVCVCARLCVAALGAIIIYSLSLAGSRIYLNVESRTS